VPRKENRRAFRLSMRAPVAVESIGLPELELHPALERIYQRVPAADERRGQRLNGVVRDLSTNGAFVAADPLPLLSRVVLRFELEELAVDAIGWILWRRVEDVEIARERGEPLALPRGFGVLFESIALEVRLRIDMLVQRGLQHSTAPGPTGSAK
jgi:PilZ domain